MAAAARDGGVPIGEPLQEQNLRLGADRFGQFHHGDAADAGIEAGAALGQVFEIVVEGVEYGLMVGLSAADTGC